MGQSSGSTPTLPYSHGQASLLTSVSSPSTIPITSSSIFISQNVTIEHSPLVSSSSNPLYHSSIQPSSTSLSDPPPYPSTILLTPLGSTLHGNHFPSCYPQTAPLFGSNPLVGSSFSFPQPTLFSQTFLNPWSFSHPIYHPQSVYATVSNTNHFPSSNISSSFSTLSISTSSFFSNTNPTFTTIFNTPRSSSSGPSRRRLIRGWKRGWGRGNTYYSTRKPYPQTFDSPTHPSAILTFLPQTFLGLVILGIFVLWSYRSFY